jgi:hypothetical protein
MLGPIGRFARHQVLPGRHLRIHPRLRHRADLDAQHRESVPTKFWRQLGASLKRFVEEGRALQVYRLRYELRCRLTYRALALWRAAP